MVSRLYRAERDLRLDKNMENYQDLRTEGICGVHSLHCLEGKLPLFKALPSTLLNVALLPWCVCRRLPVFCVALRKSHRHERKVNGRRGACPGQQWSLTSTLWRH